MKKQIVAYITGVINSYTNIIAALTTNGGFSISINALVAIKGEFESLLEVVIDIPEEKTISDFNLALENRGLKQSAAVDCNRIIELENELNQFKDANEYAAVTNTKLKIENEKLINDNQNLRIACRLLKEKVDPEIMEILKQMFKGIK